MYRQYYLEHLQNSLFNYHHPLFQLIDKLLQCHGSFSLYHYLCTFYYISKETKFEVFRGCCFFLIVRQTKNSLAIFHRIG